MSDPDWMSYAACAGVDPDLFFPVTKGRRGNAPKVTAAKAICATCTVREECLDFAISERIKSGIWGGHDYDERRAIAKRRVV